MTYEGGVTHGQVLWTDYNYHIVYECTNLSEDGSCPQGSANVVIYGPNRKWSDDILNYIEPLALNGCFAREDFEPVPHHCEHIIID